MARTVITDSGFWIGLLDVRDEHARNAAAWEIEIQGACLLMPWPCAYEVLSTRLSRREGCPARFVKKIRSGFVSLIDDSPYREAALEECSASNRALSLADRIVRGMICDPTVRKHGLLTFNPDDFRDVCSKHRVSLLSGHPSSFHN